MRHLDTAWASIVGFWLLYFLVSTVRAVAVARPHQWDMIARRAVVILLMMGVTWAVHRLLKRMAGSLPRSIVAAAAIALPAALAYSILNALVFAVPIAVPGGGLVPGQSWGCPRAGSTMAGAAAGGGLALGQLDCDDETLSEQIIGTTADGYFLFIAWSALYLALQYAGEVRALERRGAELRATAQSAELRALRYQVNPHFLFNTLNSLSSLVMTGRSQAAERMIVNLSIFFRTSLSGDPTQDVTLAEEIALQRLYLDIEAVRFPERLIVDIDYPPELGSVRVPGLILQPLVENAVKHGVSATARPVTITLRAELVGARLVLSVADDGAPAAGDGADGTDVGLRNVSDRLAARYGDAAGCRWVRGPGGGFRVELTLPLAHRAG
ncbi:sensor histidine kinase [Lichenicola sp.]|uniref:sensor histidine kinase n=1 Tax=Lichenicola sp. TaxID=2804529 RepID=UPI003AFF6FB1